MALRAFLITWVTYRSRKSPRIPRDTGGKTGIYLNTELEIKVSHYIGDIIKRDNLKCLAYNICRNHVHIIIVCDENCVPQIVQKIKSISARMLNIYLGRTKVNGKDIKSNGNKGACSLVPVQKNRGKTQNHLWAHKYNQSLISSDDKLIRAVNYVQQNRLKHDLPSNKKLNSIIEQMTCDCNTAFSI